MPLGSNYVLNSAGGQGHTTIHPFSHMFVNQRSIDDQVRAVTIPDVDTFDLPEGAKFSMSAGDFLEVYVVFVGCGGGVVADAVVVVGVSVAVGVGMLECWDAILSHARTLPKEPISLLMLQLLSIFYIVHLRVLLVVSCVDLCNGVLAPFSRLCFL